MALNSSWKHATLIGVAFAAMILVFLKGPIPQSQQYHHFADDRTLFGIPDFWNVVSNLPFVVTGFFGIWFLLKNRKRDSVDVSSLVFFSGIFLTAFGSVWYHLCPDNHTMVWDRLPMTIAFMAFFSVIVRDCIDEQAGKKVLWPLLFLGLLSVGYWQMTENLGRGDLRFYFLVQFLPMVLIPLILLLFETKRPMKIYFWLVLLAYVIAKLFEMADMRVYHTIGMSGHAIKHVVAAIASFIYLVGIKMSLQKQ